MPVDTRFGRAMQSICTLIMCCGCFSAIRGTNEHPVVPKTLVVSATSQSPIRSEFATETEYKRVPAIMETDVQSKYPSHSSATTTEYSEHLRIPDLLVCEYYGRIQTDPVIMSMGSKSPYQSMRSLDSSCVATHPIPEDLWGMKTSSSNYIQFRKKV